jgi:hypothetical protein
MRLDVAFDPDQRPEAQHQLNQIPPADRISHPILKAALERYGAAKAAEREARRTHVQLEQELPAAEYKDEVALADAREKGAKDPGPKHAEAHARLIAEAKRDAGACKIALARAVEGVAAAFEAHGDEWEADLLDERDQLRAAMAELLDGWQRLWADLQQNSANRAIGRGGPVQSPSVFCDSFRVPLVRDGSVIQVADVLEGLRDLARPVENAEGGAEPIRHTPPGKQPYAGAGSQAVSVGRTSDPERVREWVERDEAQARERAAAAEGHRAERMARASDRRAHREARRAAEDDAIEAVR